MSALNSKMVLTYLSLLEKSLTYGGECLIAHEKKLNEIVLVALMYEDD